MSEPPAYFSLLGGGLFEKNGRSHFTYTAAGAWQKEQAALGLKSSWLPLHGRRPVVDASATLMLPCRVCAHDHAVAFAQRLAKARATVRSCSATPCRQHQPRPSVIAPSTIPYSSCFELFHSPAAPIFLVAPSGVPCSLLNETLHCFRYSCHLNSGRSCGRRCRSIKRCEIRCDGGWEGMWRRGRGLLAKDRRALVLSQGTRAPPPLHPSPPNL